MTSRSATLLTWSLVALSMLLAVLSLILGLTRIAPVDGLEAFDAGEALQFVAQLSFGVVGAIIVSRHPRHLIGWLFTLMGISAVFGIFTYEYAAYALLTQPGSLPAGVEMAWLGSWVWMPSLGLWALVLLLFPNGSLPSRRWAPVAWFAAGATLLGVMPHVFTWSHRGPELVQTNGDSNGSTASSVSSAAIPLLLIIVLVAAISLIVRFRRSKGEERQQLKWFAFAAVVMLTIFALSAVLAIVGAPDWVLSLLFPVAFLGLPITAAIAILKYHLYDIDIVINRTLVYGALVSIVVGCYMLVVGGAGALLGSDGNLLLSLLVTGFIAVAFAPLQRWLQRRINRLMYGERDEPYTVLSRLGQRLEATLDPESVLPAIVETTAQALKLSYARISLRHDKEFVPAATYGTLRGETLVLPLVYRGEQVGQLILGARGTGESFTPSDRRLLDELARQAGIAVHAVHLTTELRHANASLQATRERLVTAREEERRRLRRDLHDGLGPVLGGLTLKLDIARGLVTQDPIQTAALLLELKSQSQTAVADIRRLVYELRPPALDELGLTGALRETITQLGHTQGNVRISIDVPGCLPPLPAAVEVAAYRIVQEALTNVMRHAGARNCMIRITAGMEASIITVEIDDDGIGVPETSHHGVGLASMRERAAELGGSLVIHSVPGEGTRVCAQLPQTTHSESPVGANQIDHYRLPVGMAE